MNKKNSFLLLSCLMASCLLSSCDKKIENNNSSNLFISSSIGEESNSTSSDIVEEEKLLQKLMLEDKEAKQILIERNLRLVVYIAKKFENTGIDFEDLISIGTIGLMKAINTFNVDKNIKLATYASRCIENEILMQLRRNTKIKNEISIDEPLNKDGDGNELLLSDILGTDNDITSKSLEDEVDKALLKVAISKLDKREKYIMQLRFGIDGNEKEKTQKEVADMLGISQSYISRLEKKIMKKMKKEIMSKTG